MPILLSFQCAEPISGMGSFSYIIIIDDIQQSSNKFMAECIKSDKKRILPFGQNLFCFSCFTYTENVVVLLDAKLISRTEIFLPTEDCGRSVCQKAIEQDRENQKIQWMWLYAPTRFTYSGEN